MHEDCMVIELNPRRVSLTVAILFAITHTFGIIAILSGATDYIMKIHFLTKSYIILPFDIGTYLIGVITAFVVGYVVGLVFTGIYNSVNRKTLFG